jgi:hypothetical protein
LKLLLQRGNLNVARRNSVAGEPQKCTIKPVALSPEKQLKGEILNQANLLSKL